MPELKLTRRGRRAFKAGLDMSAGNALCLEVMNKIGGNGDFENVCDIINELLARYGSAENAIVAIKSGIVGFEKIE